jgi:hypothetical protein
MIFAEAGLFLTNLGLLAQASAFLAEGRGIEAGKVLPHTATSAPACLGLYIFYDSVADLHPDLVDPFMLILICIWIRWIRVK